MSGVASVVEARECECEGRVTGCNKRGSTLQRVLGPRRGVGGQLSKSASGSAWDSKPAWDTNG